jgi:hypothetical protein
MEFTPGCAELSKHPWGSWPCLSQKGRRRTENAEMFTDDLETMMKQVFVYSSYYPKSHIKSAIIYTRVIKMTIPINSSH